MATAATVTYPILRWTVIYAIFFSLSYVAVISRGVLRTPLTWCTVPHPRAGTRFGQSKLKARRAPQLQLESDRA